MKKVLVVEDNDINYILVEALLRKENLNLVRATNGVEAIEKTKTEIPDIILMDMNMPIMGGLEATEKIREFNRDVPIIALTADVYESDKEKAHNAGCNDFLIKPINKNKLIEMVHSYL